jgi:hypothetical protein
MSIVFREAEEKCRPKHKIPSPYIIRLKSMTRACSTREKYYVYNNLIRDTEGRHYTDDPSASRRIILNLIFKKYVCGSGLDVAEVRIRNSKVVLNSLLHYRFPHPASYPMGTAAHSQE